MGVVACACACAVLVLVLRHFPPKVDRLVVEMPVQDRTLPFRWSDSSMRFSASSRPTPSICTESFVLILKRPDLMDCGNWDIHVHTLLHYAKTKYLTIIILDRAHKELLPTYVRWMGYSRSWSFPDLEHLTLLVPDTERRFESFSGCTRCNVSLVSLTDYCTWRAQPQPECLQRQTRQH